MFGHEIQNSLLIIFAKLQNGFHCVCRARHSERLQGLQWSKSLPWRGGLTVVEVILHCRNGFRHFFLSANMIYDRNELIHLKQGLPCVSVYVIVYCPCYISDILHTWTKWSWQWNCLILVWLTGKQYEFQIWSEDRGYTAGSDDAILFDCVKCRLCVSFHPYPHVYIAPKWPLFANTVTYLFNSLCIINYIWSTWHKDLNNWSQATLEIKFFVQK